VISDSTRSGVFKRDQFKCQYCGRCAPEVVLNLDHIDPHSKGGADDILNLVTSCRDCNSGKSDRRLSDDSAIAKQRAQLEELAERRSQLDMMMKWRTGMQDLGDAELDAFCNACPAKLVGWSVNDKGREEARKLIEKFGLKKCLDGLDAAAARYIQVVDGKATAESVNSAWRAIWVFAQPVDVQEMYFVRAVVRNKLNDIGKWRPERNWQALATIKRAVAAGVPIATIKEETLLRARDRYFSWADWVAAIDALADSVA